MVMNILSIDEIVSDPNIRRGRPIIAGTGIMVSDVVLRHITGEKLSIEQLAETFQLSFGQVHAVLAYYYIHQREIDDQIKTDDEMADRMIAELERKGKLTRLENMGD